MSLVLVVILTAILPVAVNVANAGATDIMGCTAPADPGDIPDGSTATREQMVSANHRFHYYNDSANAFLDCLTAGLPSATPAQQKILLQAHNRLVDEMNAKLNCFNDQLSRFQQTGGGSGGGSATCPLPRVAASSGGGSGSDWLLMLGSTLQGASQGYAASRSDNGAPVTSAQPAPPVIYNTPQSANSAAIYDNTLDRCVKLGGDGQSVYFDNGCNASVYILEYQMGQGGGGIRCGANSRCTFGIAGIGYTRREDFSYAVCPIDDYIESAPGVQWSGAGPFRCRRP